ncbi:MAG: O-antigen ligase family protein [Gemmataceae bacterium]
MHWLLIGYMFLFVHRPFEVWPALGDLRVERIYMLLTLAAWATVAPKRWLPNAQHFAYALFASAVLVAWVLSPWMDRSQPLVEDYFKVLVFYVLLVTCVHDERGLKRVVVGFLGVMGLYLTHSLREYVGGRHVYRMGIARLIGVDSTMGDPNSFGASVVFALPFVVALWRAGVGGKRGRVLLSGYVGLSVVCILLTGSRSSLLGLLFWAGLLLLRVRRRFLYLGLMLALAPAAFLALPESLQTRFETIINPDVGPENAKESGEGRVLGLLTGLDLWGANPLTGVGPGAWRPATRSTIESHNLYGQLVGELGTLGLVGFLAVLAGFWANWRAVRRVRRTYPEWENDLTFQVAGAVGTGVLLLLFMGNFGHNLFRYSWLWYGGFLIVARHCVELRVREAEWDEAVAETEPDEEEWPDGWEEHAAHLAPAGPRVGAI